MGTHTFASFADAREACGEDDTVCGTVLGDGKPVYFLAPKSTPDAALRDLAFEVRHGRRPDPVEVQLADWIDRVRP